jgi:hypothetical protein
MARQTLSVSVSIVRPSLFPTRAAPSANATAPRPSAARRAKPPANTAGYRSQATGITSPALPTSSASERGGRPIQPTGAVRPQRRLLRYKRTARHNPRQNNRLTAMGSPLCYKRTSSYNQRYLLALSRI